MKTIAFHLNNLERGGAERVVVNLSNRFVAEGYRVLIATEEYGTHEYEHDARVERVHAGLLPEDKKANRARQFILRVKRLRAFLDTYRPDVIVTFSHKCDYRALMAAKGTDIPVVVAIRTNPHVFYASRVNRMLVKHLFPRASGAVFQTRDQQAYFADTLKKNTTIILNPVDPKYFTPETPTEREKSIVHHARLVYFKNQELLIRAFLRVHRAHPDYVLRIYGDDSGDGTKEKLEALIEKEGAGDKVFLMGGDHAFEKEIPKGAVYAFTSDWEGMPNSLLEAMAMGMPVVATDCPIGGPRTVIRDGENGLLVPIGEEAALAKSLTRLIEDPALARRLGEEAAKIRADASPDAVFAKWREYLEKIEKT